ncbi:hypothetical protein [Streptomyces spongiae]|uniref:Uncharacterized protein n=1 Tax=Streptomyces spongiae TaxID=565072 RepID=A0A5N8XBB1_9ACTN|nr:hypothetical protein [Streptomyces spongiae]MPY56793.1 hypothetical protein [Streptomyces spongiae]
MSHESLSRLLSEADEDAALISGGMCVYRVLPVLSWDAPPELYGSLTEPSEWNPETLPRRLREILEGLRDGIDAERFEEAPEEIAELYAMASEMVLRFFGDDGAEIAEWSDWCSSLALDIHQQLDGFLEDDDASSGPVFITAGTQPALTPLEEAELGDQISTLVRLGSSDHIVRRSVVEIAEQGNARTRSTLERVAASL